MTAALGSRIPKPVETTFHPDAEIVILSGDVNDRISQIPDRSIALVVTSPPYNVGKPYERRDDLNRYLDAQSRIISHLYRVLRDDGSICWQTGCFVDQGEVFPLDIFFYPIFKNLGMKLRNRIIWTFGHGLHASKRFSGRYETILWLTKSDRYIFHLDAVRVPSKYPDKRHYKGPNKGKLSGNPLGKNPSDVWDMLMQDWETAVWNIPNVKFHHPEKTIHPCQFPVELVERCVLALTNKGDWVFDPFMGVGSTLVAALLHDRRALGCEKESAYEAIARQRIHDLFRGALRHRPMGAPIAQPKERTQRPSSDEIRASWTDIPPMEEE